MSRTLPIWSPAWLTLLLAAGLPAGAQYWSAPIEPRLFRFNVDQASVGVSADFFDQTFQTEGTPTSTHTRYFVGPLIGLGLSGSIYHPNLLEYQITVDGAFGYSDEQFDSTTSPYHSTQYRFLGSFYANARILDSKPFNGNLFASYAHNYQDYDFFTRIYNDTWRYGGGVHYTLGPLSLTATAYRYTYDATGYGNPIKSDSTTVSAEATYSRAYGSTSLSGSWSQYTRNDFGVVGDGSDYTLTLSDSEDFGSRRQCHSLVNLTANHYDNSEFPNDLYLAMGNLRIDHTDTLQSQYQVNYSYNQTDSSPEASTGNLSGNGSLIHHLYQSLTSELLVQGYRTSASSGENRQDAWQFGGGPRFHYTKKLSSSSSLSASESLMLLHTEVASTGGQVQVLDEPHVFNSAGGGAPPDSFRLNQPNVIESTIRITGTDHMPPGGYPQGMYTVIPNGEYTIIQRNPSLTNTMPNSVLVTYTFDSSPSGDYDTLNNACGLRFDFFNHHWAIYGRVNINRNFGAEELLAEDLNEFVVGTEGTWRFIRAGAELDIYDSSLSPFKALRFFQTFTFRPESRSTLSLSFNEHFTRYEQADQTLQNYMAILRYNRSLTRHLGLILEVGANRRFGEGVDQLLFVCRPQLQYAAGKFTASIGYDYGYDEYFGTEQRIRNAGFVRLQRQF